MPRAEADHDDPESIQVAQERRGPHERVEILRVADVPGVHHDEGAVEALLRRPGVVPRLRHELGRVDPVRDHLDPLGGSALLLEPQLHRVADRDDTVGTAEVERDEPAQRSEHERLLEALHALGDLGEDVLADHEQRHAEAPRDDEADVADDGRIGHAEDEVGPRAAERREHRVAEVARVVRGPVVELGAIVGRRADADDPHAVSLLLGREREPMEGPGDDGHVVVDRERLAELREKLRRRLDPRPVVLVEDEDPRAGLRGHDRGR